MIVEGRNGRYDVGKLAAETAAYRLYLAREVGAERECLIQVAIDAANNGELDRNAFFLRELKAKADEYETEYAKIKTKPEAMLNYHFGFPNVLDSFLLTEQGDRRLNVLTFAWDGPVANVWPLRKIVGSGRRVDIRTSAWIFGKLLKLLDFAHGQQMLVGNLQASNILIQPEEHYVLIFDWADAMPQQGAVSPEAARREIASAASVIIELVGGDFQSHRIPSKGNDNGLEPYSERLFQLAAGSSADAQSAHKEFYALLRTLGWKHFHPFTDHVN